LDIVQTSYSAAILIWL